MPAEALRPNGVNHLAIATRCVGVSGVASLGISLNSLPPPMCLAIARNRDMKSQIKFFTDVLGAQLKVGVEGGIMLFGYGSSFHFRRRIPTS